MSDVKIIPISKEYRDNYDRIFSHDLRKQAREEMRKALNDPKGRFAQAIDNAIFEAMGIPLDEVKK